MEKPPKPVVSRRKKYRRVKSPIISERPPGAPRVFRKTSAALAVEFSTRLSKMGVELSSKEINIFLINKTFGALGDVEFTILDWEAEEKRKGVNIIYG